MPTLLDRVSNYNKRQAAINLQAPVRITPMTSSDDLSRVISEVSFGPVVICQFHKSFMKYVSFPVFSVLIVATHTVHFHSECEV